jgi:hypothetical protein
VSIVNRPYAGTWNPNQRKIIQYTPDALVYLNGDTGMAGCQTCHHRIDIQQFVTSISVDAGVDPGASSSSITLSIPRHYGDSIFRDGNTILRNGLEVQVYFRGYFPMTGMADPDADPESNVVAGVNLSDIPQYPYYPVFHGVVTGVSHEYSGGYYSASLTCSGMLHFWQYMQIASNGAFFGARPNNSGVRTSLRGHVFTGMSPFSIIYALYQNTLGAAAGVGFALQSRTNMQAVSTATGDSSYAMVQQYWERRFLQGMYRLRMHGASGQLFSGSTQAYLSRLGGRDARILSVVTGNNRSERDPLASSAEEFNLIDRDGAGRINRGADLRFTAGSGGGARDYGVVVPQMQAFVNDISQWGQVNLFETTYESKLDVATQVSNICGYEFYQDMDGDLVFKPPLYNLDTSSSRIYRLEPEDIVSISFTESEPEATYATVSAGPFQNMRGAVDEAEFGVRATYYDYRLIAQFGWREGSLESNYYSNARSAFYAAVANLDKLNQGMNSASVTIPLRPEIRQGFPVYIPHIDCFYYVQSVSHAFSYGSACTTTLNLIARRRKFIPPGNPDVPGIRGITLEQTTNPPKPVQYLDNSNIPRVLGFPNVVLALDPERINPLFFVFGLDSEEDRSRATGATRQARRELLASNFAQILVDQNVIGVGTPPPAPADPTAISPETSAAVDAALASFDSAGGSTTPSATTPSAPTAPAPTATAAAVDSAAPATTYTSRESVIVGPWIILVADRLNQTVTSTQLREGLSSLIDERTSSRSRVREIDTEIQRLEHRIQQPGASAEVISTASASLTTLRAEAETLNGFLIGNTTTGSHSALSEDAALVNYLLSQIRQRNPSTASRDMSVDATGTINNSTNLLDLLGDRKAAMGINTPGYYRYYSSAHPNPNQQGYTPLATTDTTGVASDSPSETGTPESLAQADRDSTRSVAISPARRAELESQIASLNANITQMGEFVALDINPQSDLDALRAQRTSLASQLSAGIAAATASTEPATYSTVGVRDLTGEDLGADAVVNPDSIAGLVALHNVNPVNGLNVRTFNSQDPVPTPTDQIFALLFEQRDTTRVGTQTVFRESGNVRAVADAILECLNPTSRLGAALGAKYVQGLGTPPVANQAETKGALITRIVGTVAGLKGTGGTNISSPDITGGAVNGNAENAADTALVVGPTNTLNVAQNTLIAKGNRVIQQITKANEENIRRAVRLILANPPTTVPSTAPTTAPTAATPTAPTPAAVPVSETDAALAARVSRGHGTISPEVLRAVRALESNGHADAIRFEARLYHDATGITVATIPGESARARFNRVYAAAVAEGSVAHQRAAIESTSWGYYQVLGAALLAAHPSDPIEAFDNDPVGVSTELLGDYLNDRPAVRRAMEAVTANPTQENIHALACVYNGAVQPRARGAPAVCRNPTDGTWTDKNNRWTSRFTAALNNPSSGAIPRSRTTGASRGRRSGGSSGTAVRGEAGRQIAAALRFWLADIGKLFPGGVPGRLPFSVGREEGLIVEHVSTYSPVFPVSDAVGYEHYGTYQYGRGLSIEPGGNYETLMAVDPFQYVEPALAAAFADAVLRSGSAENTGAVAAALQAIASDEQFLNSPGADIALRTYREGSAGSDPQGDRTAMLASGLSNYVMSDRDAVTRLPVSNVAFRLTDLNPNMTGNDTCECRGAEADLVLGAYMRGANEGTFTTVATPDEATRWVANQMSLAADSWVLSQNALRGAALSGLGRRSVFDSVQGILGIASQVTAPFNQLGSDLAGVADPTSQNLRRLNQLAGRVG